MQKILDYIEKQSSDYKLRFANYFILKYQFNEQAPVELFKTLEWILLNDLSGMVEDLGEKGIEIPEDCSKLQCFLLLRILVSLAAYSKWHPKSEFSNYFQVEVVGDSTSWKVLDLAREVAVDLAKLRQHEPRYNLFLYTAMNSLVSYLEDGASGPELNLKENEEAPSIPFGDFEIDPFWGFGEDTWANKAKGDYKVKLGEDPFSCLVKAIATPKVEEVAPVPVNNQKVNRIQPRVFKRGEFQKEVRPVEEVVVAEEGKEPILPPDFLKRLVEEVKAEQVEGGI